MESPSSSEVLLSIVIPAYNAQATLPRTLQSLAVFPPADQHRVQVIVVNDGSTDRTAEIITEYKEQSPRFEWTSISQLNRGVAAARNVGLNAVRGQWILLLDADDEIIANPIRELHVDDSATCLVFPILFCRPNKPSRIVRPQAISARQFTDQFTTGNPFPICSLVFRKSAIDVPFDTTLRYLEDWKFWWDNPRVFLVMSNGSNAPLTAVHVHGGNRSSHFKQTSEYRGRIAQEILHTRGDSMERRQRNNLTLHLAISRVRLGRHKAISGLFTFPSNPMLYAKYLAYFVLGEQIRRLDPYG